MLRSKQKRKKKIKVDGESPRTLNGVSGNRMSLSGANCNNMTMGRLKVENVKRTDLSCERSKTCDVMDRMNGKDVKSKSSRVNVCVFSVDRNGLNERRR